ncbi:Lachesin [Eumeta japonica]|uniref:Lachesin n=1 Tax=Eumeta variegata TaxID=151549 RepID=A0A4C1YV28_EUMVA|nr:Lachesin [Eumeta japonica]
MPRQTAICRPSAAHKSQARPEQSGRRGGRGRRARTAGACSSATQSMYPRFAEPIQNVTVTVGRDALLACVVENLKGFKVAWVRMDTQTILSIHYNIITQNPRISLSYNDHRSWYLHIKNVQEVDRGWYMCQVNTDPMRSRKGYLQVVVPPSIIDNITSTDLVVREGADVKLECHASGYPEPYVLWRREDGQDFNYNGESVNVVDGEILIITKVSRLHMGAYLCIASNGVPPSISKRIMLMVQFSPMLSIPNQLEGAYVGQDVTLECHTEAFPSSINYWTTGRGDMIISGRVASFPLRGIGAYAEDRQVERTGSSSLRHRFAVARGDYLNTDALLRPDPPNKRADPSVYGTCVPYESQGEVRPARAHGTRKRRRRPLLISKSYLRLRATRRSSIATTRRCGKYEAFPVDSGYNKYMMLKIRNITKEDFGDYKCIAKNSLGETDGIIKLDDPQTRPCLCPVTSRARDHTNVLSFCAGHHQSFASSNVISPDYGGEAYAGGQMRDFKTSYAYDGAAPLPPSGMARLIIFCHIILNLRHHFYS